MDLIFAASRARNKNQGKPAGTNELMYYNRIRRSIVCASCCEPTKVLGESWPSFLLSRKRHWIESLISAIRHIRSPPDHVKNVTWKYIARSIVAVERPRRWTSRSRFPDVDFRASRRWIWRMRRYLRQKCLLLLVHPNAPDVAGRLIALSCFFLERYIPSICIFWARSIVH